MPFGARVVGRSVAALCLAASFVAAYSFAPEQQQQHHQQQQQQQGDAASNVIHPTVEIDSVWGCTGTSRTEAADCLEQSTITIRGRHFGRDSARAFLVPVHPQIPTSLNLEPIPCQRTQHSTLLPTLLLHCTLPAAAEGAAFHVRVVIHNGISAIKRNAVKYREKQSETASGSDATDAKLRLMDPARWNELGVGGLGKQFKQLFRRAFGSRLTTVSDVAAELDVRHVKGVIFYGLPGTGKTLVARKVAEALGSTHVRVVNGPEILSKFVGESEKNLRELFSDAEAAWKEKGTKSDLYVIIIDEMDGIMRSRGDRSDDSAARAVYDSVTTQMLAYMDGVKTINNLLIIGLTNRLDALDPAMLRPGRFEVQIRFPLPDGEGRRQILDIHTKSLVAHKYLAPDVDLNAIAQATASFSGADLAATVRSATSYAFERIYETAPEGKPPTFAVTQADLQRGVTETLLAKSASANTEGHLRHGIVLYNDRIKQSYSRLKEFAAHVKASPTPIMSKVLLEGTSGSGLTAFAAFAAKQSHFPYVYIISPDAYVGMSSGEKMDRITQIFDSALQAPAACIVLDDIEALLEFSAAQSSVNANMQRDLARLLRRNPAFVTGGPGTLENEGRLLVIATSTSANSVRLLTSGRILFDAVEPILDLQSGDVAAVMTAYGVPAGEGLNQLVATLPPVVGIKRVVTWLQIAASQLKDKAASTGAIRPVSGDVSGLPKLSDAQSNVRIPVDLVAKTLREYGVVDQKPSEFDMTEDFNLF